MIAEEVLSATISALALGGNVHFHQKHERESFVGSQEVRKKVCRRHGQIS